MKSLYKIISYHINIEVILYKILCEYTLINKLINTISINETSLINKRKNDYAEETGFLNIKSTCICKLIQLIKY